MQRLLREMVDRGCGACAMEVSSHALSLRRVDGTTFAAAVFTNLTRDHLDFHADMEAYFQAKRRLFEMLPPDAPSLINLDDPRGAALAEIGGASGDLRRQPAGRHHARARCRSRSRAWRSTSGRRAARCTCARRSSAGRTSTTSSPRSRRRPRSTCRSTPSSAASPRSTACPAASRWSPAANDDVTVVVDYAHTDDALRNLLETARPLARGPADHGVRLRRRSRSDEAAADGRGRRTPERRDRHHVGQPAQRGSGADHRGDPARHHARHAPRQPRSGCSRSSIAARPSPRRSSWRGPATSCSIAGKGHEKYQIDRRPGAAVRRCRGGAGSARPPAQQLRCCVARDAVSPAVSASHDAGSRVLNVRGTSRSGRRRRACRRWRSAWCSGRG